jgi:hypothetical protein
MPRHRVWTGAAGLALAAASVGLMVMRARVPGPPVVASAAGGDTQLKGAAFSLQAMVRRRGTGSVDPVLPDVPLHEGDAIRFRVRAPAPGYLLVVGIDGAGLVSAYAPASGGPIPIATAGEHDLEGSVVLDGTLGPEQVIAVLCPTAERSSRALEAARAAVARGASPGAPVRLDLNCLQAHVSYLKTR